jgi:hypothetical protein
MAKGAPRRVLTGVKGEAVRRLEDYVRDLERDLEQVTADLAAVTLAAGVSSFKGRTGAVVPATGDYTAGQVTSAVADTRQVIAGTGLTGGGALSSNVTLTVDSTSVIASTQLSRSVTANQTLPTNQQCVVSGWLEIAAGVQLTLGDGSCVELTGPALGRTTWNALKEPTKAHPDDQEFDGSWPPAGWSLWDPNALLNATRTEGGFLRIKNLRISPTQNRGVYRACPTAPEWSVWMKHGNHGLQATTTDEWGGGVFIAADIAGSPTTAKFASVENVNYVTGASYGWAVEGDTWNNYLRGGGAGIGSPSYSLFTPPTVYTRIGYDGINFYAYWSMDGVSWVHLGTVAKTFTPLYAGFACHNVTGALVTTYHYVDFYRVKVGPGSATLDTDLFLGARE